MKKLFLALIIVIVGALVLNAIDRIPTDEPTANENEYSGELEREYISPVNALFYGWLWVLSETKAAI